jgi:hypothetical protein
VRARNWCCWFRGPDGGSECVLVCEKLCRAGQDRANRLLVTLLICCSRNWTNSTTENRGRVVGAPASYFESPSFKFPPRNRLSQLFRETHLMDKSRQFLNWNKIISTYRGVVKMQKPQIVIPWRWRQFVPPETVVTTNKTTPHHNPKYRFRSYTLPVWPRADKKVILK